MNFYSSSSSTLVSNILVWLYFRMVTLSEKSLEYIFRIYFFTDYAAVGYDGSDHAAILPIPTTANVSAQSELPICLTISPVVKMITFSFL